MKELITREMIISKLTHALEELPYVHALWLEGSDGLGNTDDYSDIDFVVDVEDGFEDSVFEKVEKILLEMGELDLNYREFINHPKLRQKYYHLKDSSEYLIIDFNIQSHSRSSEESTFVRGDIVEAAKVLFDKSNVVSLKEENYNIHDIKGELRNMVSEFKSRYQQHARVIKYVRRNQYLEAYLYYMKFVVDPIIQLMRMKYTPKYYYLYLIHISNHIPDDDRLLLEEFYKVTSVDDIYQMTMQSHLIFKQLINEIEDILSYE